MKLRELSIGSFNLYNLNEPGRAIYTDRDGWTQAQYDLKILWTAAQLRSLVADVIGFQELWHRDSVQRAIDAAQLANDFDSVPIHMSTSERTTSQYSPMPRPPRPSTPTECASSTSNIAPYFFLSAMMRSFCSSNAFCTSPTWRRAMAAFWTSEPRVTPISMLSLDFSEVTSAAEAMYCG